MTAKPACTCEGCCEACDSLLAQYATDPQVIAFYRKRLLVRGWAGLKTPEEKAYILAHAPFAQAAAKAGAANIARYPKFGTKTPPTDATDTAHEESYHPEEILAPIGADRSTS